MQPNPNIANVCAPNLATAPEDGNWRNKLSLYQSPSNLRGFLELVTTAVPFAMMWCALAVAVRSRNPISYAVMLLPTSGLLVRLFILQHDCGHRGLFVGAKVNDWVGRVLSLVTATPYDHWRRCHALHHATHGNLRRRGVGDIDTLTVSEYLTRSFWTRLRYRAYRNPLVMFGIGPLFVFLVQNRFPAGHMDQRLPWISTMCTNIGMVLVVCGVVSIVGWRTFLLVQGPVLVLGATLGVWLFYVQHQFQQNYWRRQESWTFEGGALQGSSHYDLPIVLRWFTANIGVHHVHHLSSAIPFYRLPTVLRDYPELANVNRLTLLMSFSSLRLALWDEATSRMISFADLRRESVGA